MGEGIERGEREGSDSLGRGREGALCLPHVPLKEPIPLRAEHEGIKVT